MGDGHSCGGWFSPSPGRVPHPPLGAYVRKARAELRRGRIEGSLGGLAIKYDESWERKCTSSPTTTPGNS